jgi:hypothetical protein
MATTTNYGFEIPDDTDLVKDGALAMRTLGQEIDTRVKALNPETTTGDIAYRSATANTNTRLALGTAGQVLTVNSGATAPEWAAPEGGGKVLQVISATTSTTATSTSTSLADTNLTATITPTLATSKVLVLVSQQLYIERGADAAGAGVALLRNSTDIYSLVGSGDDSMYIRAQGAGSVNAAQIFPIVYLDSPATTSATTYKTQFRVNAAGATGKTQDGNAVSSIVLMEIGA